MLVCTTSIAGPLALDRVNAQRRPESPLTMRVFRFWRDGNTQLEGVVGMPLGGGNPAVRLAIRDQSGLVLREENWTDTLSAQASALATSRPNAEWTTPIRLRLQPGSYTLDLRVNRANRSDSMSVPVQSFAAQPLMSDVIVSSRIRALNEGETESSAELKLGRFAIERGAKVTVLPTEPNLWYYVELYTPPGSAVNAVDLTITVTRAEGGAPLVRLTRSVPVSPRGGVDASRLVLAGLPPGDFKLGISAKAAGREEQREATFTMASLEEMPEPPAAAAGSETALYGRYFAPAVKTDAQIGQILEALTIAAVGDAVPRSTLQLDGDAKRRFLARYWARLDNTPETPTHELLEEYMQRVAHVVRDYTETQPPRSAFLTDRGRVYLKYGAPDAKQVLPLTSSRAVEVWKYTRRRSFKFAFLDETGFSNFNLMYTTDPAERTVPDWQERVRDAETIRLILSF